MNGWKTNTGAAITAIATCYNIYTGAVSFGDGLAILGGVFSMVGIGHKIDKSKP
jgi:hypothetical protein